MLKPFLVLVISLDEKNTSEFVGVVIAEDKEDAKSVVWEEVEDEEEYLQHQWPFSKDPEKVSFTVVEAKKGAYTVDCKERGCLTWTT